MSNAKGILIIAAVLVAIAIPYWQQTKNTPSQSEYEQYKQEYYEEKAEEEEAALEQSQEDDPVQYALDQNPDAISWDKAFEHIGEHVIICGIVEEVDSASANANPIFVDVGDTYPHERVTGVIWKEYQSAFSDINDMKGQLVYMEGTLYEYDGLPNIELTDPSQIEIVE